MEGKYQVILQGRNKYTGREWRGATEFEMGSLRDIIQALYYYREQGFHGYAVVVCGDMLIKGTKAICYRVPYTGRIIRCREVEIIDAD